MVKRCSRTRAATSSRRTSRSTMVEPWPPPRSCWPHSADAEAAAGSRPDGVAQILSLVQPMSTSTGTTPADITAAVLASFEQCSDPRLRALMQALVRHLHEFAVDVGLTEEEWRALIGVLTQTGHLTDEKRQEFILWSDTLGLSMLVDALTHVVPAGATESTVLGPFYVPGSPAREYGAAIAEEPAGGGAW